MSEKKTVEQVPDPELDSLLDDAFKDFSRPLQPQNVKQNNVPPSVSCQPPSNVWTEEFIQEQTKSFEETLRSIMEHQKSTTTSASDESNVCTEPPSNETVPNLDINNIASDFAKLAEAAATAVTQKTGPHEVSNGMANIMKQLAENNKQLKDTPTADDLNQMFGSMGLGGGDADGDMGNLFPLMQSMLENILGKDVLYPPIKEIVDKYPDWLADNRASLPPEEFERCNAQFDLMNKIVQLFEEESDGDSEETKSKRFEQILQSMQKLQELGQPPKDLVGDMEPAMDFEEPGAPAMPVDFMSLLSGGFAAPPTVPNSEAQGADGTGETSDGSEQCSIM